MWVMWATLWLLACSGEAPPAVLTEASREVTFGTMQELGTHTLQASWTRRVGPAEGGGQETAEAFLLRWQDPDHWELRRERQGRVQSHVIIWDAIAWVSGPKGLKRRGDGELYRVQLASGWDPWQLVLAGFNDQLGLVRVGEEMVDGRKAWRHDLVLKPPLPGRRAWTPTQVEGAVWLDEALAVRLGAEVHLVAVNEREAMDLRFRLSVSGVGADPGITPITETEAASPGLPEEPAPGRDPGRRPNR